MTTLIPQYDLMNGGNTPTGAINRPINQKLQEWVSVKDFGAKGDGTTNDTVAINNALTYVSSLGGGAVIVPLGTYIITQIKMQCSTALIGMGWGSILKQAASSNTNAVVLANTSTQFTQLRDIQIQGNNYQNTSGDGINYVNAGGTFSSPPNNFHLIDNVFVWVCAGNGITLDSGVVEAKLSNIVVQACNGYGYNLSCTDSQFVNCTAGSSGLNGFNLNCPNSRFANSKSYGSGRVSSSATGAGWYISNPRIQLANCEAQDNGWHGFIAVGVSELSLMGIVADSNGNVTPATGIRIDNSSYVQVSGVCYNRPGVTATQTYGLDISSGTPSHNNYQINAYNNVYGALSGTVDPTSTLLLNGNVYGNLYGNNSVTVTTLSTNTQVLNYPFAGLLVIRDNTSGGTGVFMLDPNAGVVQISWNGNGQIYFYYVSGAWYIQKTSGTVPTFYNISTMHS